MANLKTKHSELLAWGATILLLALLDLISSGRYASKTVQFTPAEGSLIRLTFEHPRDWTVNESAKSIRVFNPEAGFLCNWDLLLPWVDLDSIPNNSGFLGIECNTSSGYFSMGTEMGVSSDWAENQFRGLTEDKESKQYLILSMMEEMTIDGQIAQLVIFSNFLHHYDPPVILSIINVQRNDQGYIFQNRCPNFRISESQCFQDFVTLLESIKFID